MAQGCLVLAGKTQKTPDADPGVWNYGRFWAHVCWWAAVAEQDMRQTVEAVPKSCPRIWSWRAVLTVCAC